MNNDDRFYMDVARVNSGHARCQKKKLGTVLVCKDTNGIVVMVGGSNGAPSDLPACGMCQKDGSGEANAGRCPAVHAERAPLLEAAKRGVPTRDSILYCAFGIPCKNCLLELKAAGVKEIVVERWTFYDDFSMELVALLRERGMNIRTIEE